MAAAAVLKNEKSKYLCNRLTDFDEIWYADASRPYLPKQPIKLQDFKNPRWRRRPILKFEKSQYLCNGTTDFDEIWYNDAYETSRHGQSIKFCEFDNPRWRRTPS